MLLRQGSSLLSRLVAIWKKYLNQKQKQVFHKMLKFVISQDELKAILSEAKANPNMQYITAGVRQRQFPLLNDLKVMFMCR